MPFIKLKQRRKIDHNGLKSTTNVGDICYFYYTNYMINVWKKTPRWTTAHYIRQRMIKETGINSKLSLEKITAYKLAWEVFFQRFVMPYEQKKIKENGDIL